MFHIVLSIDVERESKNIPSFYRNRILDTIEQQRTHQLTRPSRNKKLLVNLTSAWKNDLVIWELRVGLYRVFYDVNETEKEVAIRTVRKKARTKLRKTFYENHFGSRSTEKSS